MQGLGRLCHRTKHVSSPTASPARRLCTLEVVSRMSTPLPFRVSTCDLSPARSRVSSLTRMMSGLSTAGPNSTQQKVEAESPVDAFTLVAPDISRLTDGIHAELDEQLKSNSELSSLSKYYFDGKGKAIRPVIALCIGHAYNHHTNRFDDETLENQRKVALISEMIHTASLLHDDILDHAQTRRSKQSVNLKWDLKKSTMAGDYIIGVGSRLLASTKNPDVIQILSQVLSDLVEGEFMQLQNKEDENERFEHYLNKSFNKTASLIAYTCKANVVLSGGSKQDIENSFQYGRNIGIAFQLVDDLLDFVASADQLGKPAAADLELGLATAPVLFAARKFPELDSLIARRFSQDGDVDLAFRLVLDSDGLGETKQLATTHCKQAVSAISDMKDSPYKAALISLSDKVLNRLN